MRAEHRSLKWTLMLLFLGAVLCSTWKVDYQQQHICAVTGSTLVIPCSFTYPGTQIVRRVMWAHDRFHIFDGPFIYDSDSNTSSKFHYIGDKLHNCSFQIHQVEHTDAGKYAFRFTTENEKWTGCAGSTLKVVDLNITVTKPAGNGIIKEGDSVTLTCINSCDGGNLSSAFTWFKNGESIHEGRELYLRSISSTNSGNYTCSLQMHAGTTSGVIPIDVEYGPKNTSVSVTPETETDAGRSFTLICSSHANPPVENYTWFKMHNSNMIAVGHRHEQHLNVSQGDDGQYLCSATNKHGSHNSSTVTLRMKVYWATVTRDGVIIATSAAALLTATIAAAVRRLYKKRTVSPETDCEVDIQNTDYVNWPVFETTQSRDGNEAELTYATVHLNTERMSYTAQQMDSHNDEERVIYSNACRNQPLNLS